MRDQIVVRLEHMRSLRYCSRGARDFFERNELDWATFIREGLPVEEIEATGDAMALKVAEVARGRKQ